MFRKYVLGLGPGPPPVGEDEHEEQAQEDNELPDNREQPAALRRGEMPEPDPPPEPEEEEDFLQLEPMD